MSNIMLLDIYVMFLNPPLTFHFKMFTLTKTGIGALSETPRSAVPFCRCRITTVQQLVAKFS